MRATQKLIQYSFSKLNFLAYSFSSIDNTFYRNLTRKIMGTQNEKQLFSLLTQYKRRMNIYNISAILKKLTKFDEHNDELIKAVFQELSLIIPDLIEKQDIQMDKVRALSNIICYVGNLKYFGLNDMLSKIKYQKIIVMGHFKQFVMLITGLLKLSLVEKCIDRSHLKQTMKKRISGQYNVGLIISLWRNLLKYSQSDEDLNEYFIAVIVRKQIKYINLKDYGYLVYSFLQSYSSNRRSNADIILLLKSYPNQIMYSARINIYQLCILIDNLGKLKQIVQIYLQDEFIELIYNHYERNINMKSTKLRHLANGFDSLVRFFKYPQISVCFQTKTKFLAFLSSRKELSDHQSITSLFVQLTIQLKPEQNVQRPLFQTSNFNNQASMVDAVTDAIFPFVELSNKYLQKYIYGLYLHQIYQPQFVFNKEAEVRLLEEVMKRKFQYKQIESIVPFLWFIGIRNRKLCNYFRENLEEFQRNGMEEEKKLEKRLRDRCLMGDKGCLRCYQL